MPTRSDGSFFFSSKLMFASLVSCFDQRVLRGGVGFIQSGAHKTVESLSLQRGNQHLIVF